MWVIGGYADDGPQNDVWYSYDGMDWTQATASAEWVSRYDFQAYALDGKLWVVGGTTHEPNLHYLTDVWYSFDGVTWFQATDNAPYDMLDGFSGAMFHDRVWVLGGFVNWYKSMSRTAWSTRDGVSWTCEGSCGYRYLHTSAVFDDKLWVIAGNVAGYYSNETAYSPDGANWTVTPAPPWHARIRHASVGFDNKLWVLGGLDEETGETVNDVWYAEVAVPDVSFIVAPESGAAPLEVQFTDTTRFDAIMSWAWAFGDGATSADQHPSHTYALPGTYTVTLTITTASGSNSLTKPDSIAVSGIAPHDWHSADTDQNGVISLTELLRIIQFYNVGAFHCQPGTGDGYAPLDGDTTCAYHDSDFSPPDWRISLSEILRLIQFFNTGGYHACFDNPIPTGDGFCPGK